MGQLNRQRHQFRSFVAGKPKHQSLVAGAAGINAHRDIGRLPIDGGQDTASVAVETILGSRVTNVSDRLARDSPVVDASVGGDFAGNHDQAGRHQSFTGNAGGRIFSQARIQHCV